MTNAIDDDAVTMNRGAIAIAIATTTAD